MEKTFISAQDLLCDSFALARQVLDSGFQPNFIIGVWRGGAPVGIAIQEFLDYVGIETDHIAIRTSSYVGVNQQNKVVRVHGLDYIIDNINADDRVLLVDDVFDSGRSIQAILKKLKSKTRRNMPSDIRIACPWYKPSRNKTKLVPHFFVHETDDWLVFPHELKGLSSAELRAGKPELMGMLQGYLMDEVKTN